ncbi:MAG: hypothetical protein FJ088_09770, partial [Deltaproteobacteria bacterium]|nr:hypothetical protein [Deltaproteobacteria bacterium]
FQEVIVTAWEDNLITSPSSQLWIPAEPEIPICEGVFDQILHGDEKVFGGSVPTALPDGIAGEFAAASLAIAGFFQKIGYQGRCSFDAIVPAENRGAARVKFVECNGRWGGTSIPMFLYKRVFGADAKGAKNMAKTYIAADYTDARLKGSDFKVLKDILNGYLYNPRTGSGNALLYNAGCLKDFGKFDIIVNGLSRDEVSKFLNFTMPFLFNRFFS